MLVIVIIVLSSIMDGGVTAASILGSTRTHRGAGLLNALNYLMLLIRLIAIHNHCRCTVVFNGCREVFRLTTYHLATVVFHLTAPSNLCSAYHLELLLLLSLRGVFLSVVLLGGVATLTTQSCPVLVFQLLL